jgi:hypothetical protein
MGTRHAILGMLGSFGEHVVDFVGEHAPQRAPEDDGGGLKLRQAPQEGERADMIARNFDKRQQLAVDGMGKAKRAIAFRAFDAG